MHRRSSTYEGWTDALAEPAAEVATTEVRAASVTSGSAGYVSVSLGVGTTVLDGAGTSLDPGTEAAEEDSAGTEEADAEGTTTEAEAEAEADADAEPDGAGAGVPPPAPPNTAGPGATKSD